MNKIIWILRYIWIFNDLRKCVIYGKYFWIEYWRVELVIYYYFKFFIYIINFFSVIIIIKYCMLMCYIVWFLVLKKVFIEREDLVYGCSYIFFVLVFLIFYYVSCLKNFGYFGLKNFKLVRDSFSIFRRVIVFLVWWLLLIFDELL